MDCVYLRVILGSNRWKMVSFNVKINENVHVGFISSFHYALKYAEIDFGSLTGILW
jgi:hypothetical protein